MSIKIRKYQPADWDAVCEVHDRARPLEVQHFMPGDKVETFVEVYREDGFFDGQQFVAEEEGQVVGFICIDGDELTWLYAEVPPRPSQNSLRLAGYDESDWGTAVRGEDDIWRWQKMV